MFSILRAPVKLADGIADRIFAALGAILLSQFPQFFGQYMQRLGGHLDEAENILGQYVKTAADLNLTIEEYIHEHLTSGSDIFASSGIVIGDLLERVQSLRQSYLSLQDTTIYNRWFIFIREVDWSIAANTWRNFLPGIPTTMEGLTYALAGLLIGWGIYALIKTIICLPFKLLAAKRK